VLATDVRVFSEFFCNAGNYVCIALTCFAHWCKFRNECKQYDFFHRLLGRSYAFVWSGRDM